MPELGFFDRDSLNHPCYEKAISLTSFSHREMIRETRRRFKELPEVRWKVVEAKRRSAYRTNLVMRDIYNRRLQEKVLSGKVSMVTHRNVVDI